LVYKGEGDIVKRPVIRKKIFFIFFLCAIFNAQQYGNAQVVSFDALFPESHFHSSLDLCMKIWADVKLLHDIPHHDTEYYEIYDLIVGRLVRLNRCVDTLIKEIHNGFVVTRSDIDYLLAIIDHIIYEPIFHKEPITSCHAYLYARITSVREKMLALL
jgi:hypothetical protein